MTERATPDSTFPEPIADRATLPRPPPIGIARLHQNVIALTALQASNYLIPLITLPYLTRVLGPERYGVLATVFIAMQYIIIFTDYGFSWTATRDIAAHRTSPEKTSAIFSATWAAQWLLTGISFLLLCTAIVASPVLWQDRFVYLMGFTIVIGHLLFPLWLLNGLECMREIAAFQVFSRLAMLPLLFLFVRKPADLLYAVLITGVGSIISGTSALLWIRKRQLVRMQSPNIRSIGIALREGGQVFGSRVSISLYTILTPILLGAFAGTTEVGYFNVADRVRNAAQSLLSPISQTLFPRMSHLYAHDLDAAQGLLRRSILATTVVSASSSAALWILSDWIILILAGNHFANAASVLRWMSPLPLVVGLSNVFGIQVMLPNHLHRSFNVILLAAGIISLLLISPLVLWKQSTGAAITLLITESFVTCTMAIYLSRTGLLPRRVFL